MSENDDDEEDSIMCLRIYEKESFRDFFIPDLLVKITNENGHGRFMETGDHREDSAVTE